MTFAWALQQIRRGQKVARTGWNGKHMWIKLFMPHVGSDVSLPYIYMFTADKQTVPWLASQTDLLAEDWGFSE